MAEVVEPGTYSFTDENGEIIVFEIDALGDVHNVRSLAEFVQEIKERNGR